jgi:Transposase DDE domain
MPRRMGCTAKTSTATRCPIGSATRSGALRKSERPRAALEAEAKAAAEAEEERAKEGRKKPGKPAAPPSTEPDPKAQMNFTDPESSIMKSKDGFIQAYNAQAAVDATAQVIVAHGLDAKGSDQHQLVAMADAIEANLGQKPTQLSADAGYCSDPQPRGAGDARHRCLRSDRPGQACGLRQGRKPADRRHA